MVVSCHIKMTRHFQIIFYLLTIMCFSNCQNSGTECPRTAPSHLIDNFYSYQTIADFEKEIKNSYETIIVIENSKLSDTDKRPPFDIYTISIPEFKHLGLSGQLRASFFNNRLQSIWFYPDNVDEYLKELDNDLKINLKEEKEIRIDCVSITKWTDFKDDLYFSWTDTRLQQEQNDWISKYS